MVVYTVFDAIPRQRQASCGPDAVVSQCIPRRMHTEGGRVAFLNSPTLLVSQNVPAI